VLRVHLFHGGVLSVALVVAAALPMAPEAAVGLAAETHASARVAQATWRPDSAVRAIAVSRTRVYIAGDFRHVRNTVTGKKVRRDRVAAFDRRTGALIRGFHPRANRRVDTLALLGNKLVLGGYFTSLNGRVRQHLGAVSAKSGHLSPWRAKVDGPVFTVLSMRGQVYVGGDFRNVNDVLRTHLFALDGHGVLSPTWPDQAAGTTNRGVYTLVASADRRSVLVGGSFDKLAGSPRTYLGEIESATGKVTDWNPPPVCLNACFVKTLATDKARVYAGITGPGGDAVAYRRDTGAVAWKKHASGDVTAIALAGRRLYLGGHFHSVNRHRHPMFAALKARTGKVTPRRPRTTGTNYPGILVLSVHDHRIRIGGAFDTLAGQARYAVLPQ
jgi:outer membrane protein assembly factor BamB